VLKDIEVSVYEVKFHKVIRVTPIKVYIGYQ
jgi:hypothetical protein